MTIKIIDVIDNLTLKLKLKIKNKKQKKGQQTARQRNEYDK